MTLEQLRIFIAVAEREHITRAAEYLNLTQSAVSHAVTQLENAFQLSFFSRIGRRIVLTEAGRIFLEEARSVRNRADRTRERMNNLAGLHEGVLRVHASHTIASYWLPARLNRFRLAHPSIRLHVTIANTRDICKAVQSGEAEVGLIEGDLATPELCSDVVAADQLLLVVAPHHPWASTPPRPDQLTETHWVLRETGSGTRLEFERDLLRLGVAPENLSIMIEVASNEAMASTVETGDTAAVLSASVVAGRIEAGTLHSVPFPLPERKFRVIRHPERRLSPTEQTFLTLLGTDTTQDRKVPANTKK